MIELNNLQNRTYWEEVVKKLTLNYQEQINHINPNVKEWPLMSSPMPTLYLSFTYLFLVKFLSFLMKYIKELNIKYIILSYNLLSIFLNVYISLKIIYIKYKAKDFHLCTNIHSQDTAYSLEMNKIIWWFYISKGVEFLDTIFFLLRKKFHKISFLHIYNHATMFPIWWLCTSYLANGTSAVAALMNSILHVLLYYYYCISTIGQKYQKYVWWKRYFVLLQMLQFCILIVFCSLLLYADCGYGNGMDRMIWCVIYYSLSHVVLIYDFYSKSYYKVMVNNLDKKSSAAETIKVAEIQNTPSKNRLSGYMLRNLPKSPSSDLKVTKRRPLR